MNPEKVFELMYDEQLKENKQLKKNIEDVKEFLKTETLWTNFIPKSFRRAKYAESYQRFKENIISLLDNK